VSGTIAGSPTGVLASASDQSSVPGVVTQSVARSTLSAPVV